MSFLKNKTYQNDICFLANQPLPWEKLKGKSVLITGATGMIGTVLVDVFRERNIVFGNNIHIIAVGRNESKAISRFGENYEEYQIEFIKQDINEGFSYAGPVDFALYAASNTHPRSYATDPIGTVLTNITGADHVLSCCAQKHTECFVYFSSVEIYGENRGDADRFDESYCGYIDCNTLRAGYPESKRAGEALCQAYSKQYDMHIVIPRLCRAYGPTLLSSDSKALSQFLHNALNHEDIVLKSEGTQFYSYLHVTDVVCAVLWILLKGERGTSYNVADSASDISLRDLAALIAKQAGVKVVFALPDAVEKAGYSKATRAVLDASRLKSLGWVPKYSIQTGIENTLSVMEELQ